MNLLKVVTSQEMARMEESAIRQGADPEHFMLEAGKQVARQATLWIERKKTPKRIGLLIGKGNNGGDAWAAGAFLREEGFEVHAYPIFPSSLCSPLNQKMGKLFLQKQGKIAKELHFEQEALLLDGLLGTGFSGQVEGKLKEAIDAACDSRTPILAIDIPSGLDGTTGEVRGAAIRASLTVALGCLKSGFFLREGWNHVGKIQLADFGMPQEFVEKAAAFSLAPSIELLKTLLPPIIPNRHKYQAGYVLGYGGSELFPGAVKLSGMGALRAGAGIVRLFSPEPIGDAPDELICHIWNESEWYAEMKRAQAVFVGPGLGQNQKAWLVEHLPRITAKCVIDADALQPQYSFPKQAILTPHRGEALRLLGLKQMPVEEELLELCGAFCKERGLILILKGAPSFVVSADQNIVIPFGDPGMATAGSGDVLTGILAALLAQGMEPIPAAILGASLHAIAGEEAARVRGSYGLMASDIVNHLSHAYLRLM
ncbi:MAG: NAD(P)H-hydrate dehydratase [Chlamydiia bacterium]|nr:NAD(P)H-hydrate dehydratase [Chlamydiia bacterium]